MDIDPQRRYTRNSIATHVRLGFKKADLFWRGEERPEGFDPIQRDPIPGFSEYDQARWPRESLYPVKGKHITKDIWPIFLLRYHEFEDLCFMKRPIPKSDLIAHEYLSCELERRAWEKYGGQFGLAAARDRQRNPGAQPPALHAHAALPGLAIQNIYNDGWHEAGGQAGGALIGPVARLRGGYATAEPSTPVRARPYDIQARHVFPLSPPLTNHRHASNVFGSPSHEDSKAWIHSNTDSVPVTPVRDLTRKDKERERQAQEASNPYPLSPLTQSRKPLKKERRDESSIVSQLLTMDPFPSPTPTPRPLASSSRIAKPNFKQEVTTVDPSCIDLTLEDSDSDYAPSTPSRKSKKGKGKVMVIDTIYISD